MLCWDSNSQPSECESPLLTARPGLPPKFLTIPPLSKTLCNDQLKFLFFTYKLSLGLVVRKESYVQEVLSLGD